MPQGNPIVVHGHTRQAYRVARDEVFAHLVQMHLKGGTLVFLYPEIRMSPFCTYEITPGKSGHWQSESARKRTESIALHFLFRHGLPVRVVQFQHHLTPLHGMAFSLSLIVTQSTHIHRLSGAVHRPVCVQTLPHLFPFFFVERHPETLLPRLGITVIPFTSLYRQAVMPYMVPDISGIAPTGFSLGIRQSGMQQRVTIVPFHRGRWHGPPRTSLHYRAKASAVRQETAHQ